MAERDLLLRIIDVISHGPRLAPLAQRVAELIVSATATDLCFVHVLDDDGRTLTLSGATPPFDAYVGKVTFALGEGVSGWVASRAEPVVVVEGERVDPCHSKIPELRGDAFTSMVSVPMISPASRPIGVLNVYTRQRREFGPTDVRLLQSIGTLVAGAIGNARLLRRLEIRRQEQEDHAARVVAIQEAERQRLAADIHDGVSQRIVSMAFHLAAAASALPDDPVFAAEQVATARKLADDALAETRVAIAGLRPPLLDDLGLAASLENLAGTLPGVSVELDVQELRLPSHVETALYRVAQEALQNVAKHAHASRVWVELRAEDGTVRLRIRDDGEGFDPGAVRTVEHGSYGLRGMAERAELVGGTLHIVSRPAAGTTLTFTVPRR